MHTKIKTVPLSTFQSLNMEEEDLKSQEKTHYTRRSKNRKKNMDNKQVILNAETPVPFFFFVLITYMITK